MSVEAQSTQIPGNSGQLQLETKQRLSRPAPLTLQCYQQENPAKIKKKKKNFLRSNDTLAAMTTLGAISWLL